MDRELSCRAVTAPGVDDAVATSGVLLSSVHGVAKPGPLRTQAAEFLAYPKQGAPSLSLHLVFPEILIAEVLEPTAKLFRVRLIADGLADLRRIQDCFLDVDRAV